MIKNVDILNWLYRVLRKEARGNVISPLDFNTHLAINQRLRFDERLKQLELTDAVSNSLEVYFVTELLSLTRVPIEGEAVFGYVDLPRDYEKALRCMAEGNKIFDRKVDGVTQLEMQERMSNSLTKPTSRNPVYLIEDGQIKVYPYVNKIRLTYVKTPEKAFLDYVVNTSNRGVRYLDEEETVVEGTNEVWANKDSSWVAKTKEMLWSDEDTLAVAHKILRGIAPSIKDAGAYQLGTEETQKAERL